VAQVLVAGASGRLRSVVYALLSAGHRVRVTARNPSGAGARELSSRGGEIVQADLDDRASLTAAMADVDAVFGAGSPHQAGPEGETRHGINLAEAAADAGVGHLVFSSGDGADRPTGVPVLESKRGVELRIRELGLPHTILAPVGMRMLFAWLDREGHRVDVAALRTDFPSVRWHRFADWAASQRWPVGERANSDVL